ncbi:MAG: mechanosensitive ion channel family protein [Methanomassiliicoccales archaeon]
MTRKILYLLAMLGGAVLLLLLDEAYPQDYLQKGYMTLLALAAVYLVLMILIEEAVSRRITDARTRYSLRKTVYIIFLSITLIILIRVWVADSQALVVSYGLVGAGVAIALQDMFRNFAGGVMLFTSGIYRVGDRIEVKGTKGDVLDIGILYTTLLEIQAWVDGDQPTGRLVTIPNGLVIGDQVWNYTRDHGYLWDELVLPLSYRSDLQEAIRRLRGILIDEASEYTKGAGKDIERMGEKYYVPDQDLEPAVFITPNDNWVDIKLRYVTPAKERRFLRERILRGIMKEIESNDLLEWGSSTVEITRFPDRVEPDKGDMHG